MKVVIEKSKIMQALEALQECLAADPTINYNPDKFLWKRGEKVIACPVPQGADCYGLVVFESGDLRQKAREALRSYYLPTLGEFTLRGVDEEKARKLLLNRTGIDISDEPRYFLHRGRIEVVLSDGTLAMACYGDKEALKHGTKVLSILQDAMR